MCRATPLAAARVAALLLVFGLAHGVAGSCLSYGHSCWGAHGKRSGGGQVIVSPPADTPDVVDDASEVGPDDTRWLLSKLVVRRLDKGRPGDDSEVHRSEDAAPVLVPGPEFPEDLSPEAAGEVLLMAEEQPVRRPQQKLHLYKILNHSSARKMD